MNRQPKLIETDDGHESRIETFTHLLNNKKPTVFCRYTSQGSVIPERFNRTNRRVSMEPLGQKGIENMVDNLSFGCKKNR